MLPMCGRYRLSRHKEFIAEYFGVEPDEDWTRRYNIAPTQSVPVIHQHREEPKRLGSSMRWGLIPFLGEGCQHRVQDDKCLGRDGRHQASVP